MLNSRMENDGISAATRNRHLAMLKSMFQCAIKWELMRENPARGIPKLRETGARTRFLDLSEIQRLIKAASNRFRPLLIAAIHTGMRRGELFNLRWPDIDLSNRILYVRQSKSGKQRAIPIDQTFYDVLRALPSRFQKGYVFPSPSKQGFPMVELKHTFRRLAKSAGIENVRFHDLRHTFASHLVMNGVDIRTVQELLGHASLTMTMRYAHLAPVHRTRALQILDSALATDTKTDTVANQAGSGLL
jgi:integrase